MMTCHSVSSGFVRGGDHRAVHARPAGLARLREAINPAWRRPTSGQPWPLVSRPSSSSWPPSRSRCWCPATARRAARARRPTRRRAIRQERRERRSRCRRPRRGRARPRCLQDPRRPLARPRRLRPRRLRLRIPPRLRRSPPRLRPVPRRAAHPDTQGITAAEPGNLVQRPTAPNTQICAPRETSTKSQAAAPNGGDARGPLPRCRARIVIWPRHVPVRIHGGGVPAVRQGDALAEVPCGHHAGAGQQPADPRCRARGLGARRVRAAGDDRPPYRAGAAYPGGKRAGPRYLLAGRRAWDASGLRPHLRAEPRVRVKADGLWRAGTAVVVPGDDAAVRSRTLPHRWDAAAWPSSLPSSDWATSASKATMPPENLAMSKCPCLSSRAACSLWLPRCGTLVTGEGRPLRCIRGGVASDHRPGRTGGCTPPIAGRGASRSSGAQVRRWDSRHVSGFPAGQ